MKYLLQSPLYGFLFRYKILFLCCLYHQYKSRKQSYYYNNYQTMKAHILFFYLKVHWKIQLHMQNFPAFLNCCYQILGHKAGKGKGIMHHFQLKLLSAYLLLEYHIQMILCKVVQTPYFHLFDRERLVL